MTPSAQIAGGRRVTRWSRETIIEKINEWVARHGEAPSSADWNPSLARWRAQEWRIERYRDGEWPSTNAVKRHFGGSFDGAIRAAGLEPARPGPRRAAGSARPAVSERERPAPVPDAERRVQARVDAALDQADAAVREAARWREAAIRAERRALAAEGRLTSGDAGEEPEARALTAAEIEALRRPGPVGPAVLTDAVKRLAAARARGDRTATAHALGDVAAAAIGWRDRL
jgi:hypothetical protein